MARILLGDSDREHLVSVLRQHYAAGRFDLDDLRRRAEIVYTAVYRDEARPALDGLPPVGGVEPQSSQPRAGQRREGWPRRRGHAQARTPEPGWVRTDERFRDPSSGTIMRVWVDPADGSRHYVPDDAAEA